jgi:hypothetical protein
VYFVQLFADADFSERRRHAGIFPTRNGQERTQIPNSSQAESRMITSRSRRVVQIENLKIKWSFVPLYSKLAESAVSL